jgi:hypothetical protein
MLYDGLPLHPLSSAHEPSVPQSTINRHTKNPGHDEFMNYYPTPDMTTLRPFFIWSNSCSGFFYLEQKTAFYYADFSKYKLFHISK